MTEEKIQEDTLLNGHKILQNPQSFMFGIDAVLLAHFASSFIRKKDCVMDLCCGNGIIPLLLDTASTAKKISGLEIQPASVELAAKSVELNGLGDKIQIVEGDLKNVKKLFEQKSFSLITCNPPYMPADSGKINPADSKAIARHEIFCTLEDVIKAASYLLEDCGSMCMIHRPNRLSDLIYLCKKYKMEPKTLRMILPFENKSPTMVLLEARKSAKSDLKVLEHLTVYKSKGQYTDEVQEIYRSFTK